MAKKKQNTVVNNIDTVNVEIDYDKLAKAIIKAQKEAEEQKEKEQLQAEEQHRKETVKRRIENLGCQNVFDENGTLKSKMAMIKVVWKLIKCKETCLKNISLLGDTVNWIVSVVFFLIEWALYLLSVGFVFYGIGQPIYNYVTTNTFSFLQISVFATSLMYALVLFVVSRLVIRTLKIECKYNKDSNYMLNFLAVIIAVIAVLVSVVVR